MAALLCVGFFALRALGLAEKSGHGKLPFMLFNFLGSPMSGKTTTAAMAFASLKEDGFIAEFSSEQARLYIAQMRVLQDYKPEEQLTLTDADQLDIMARQLELDETLLQACGPGVFIISDSSPLNSLLYMSPECRRLPEVMEMVKHSLQMTTTTFYTHPIYRGCSDQRDPNRVHDYEQSQKIDLLIPQLLAELPELNSKTVPVWGTTSERLLVVKDRLFMRSARNSPSKPL